MPHYRCCFLDRYDCIREVEMLQAANEAAIADTALMRLRARPNYVRVEVWDGARRLYRSYESLFARQTADAE
jgi:hypothetical protein